jgi:hypothetical protein
LCRHYPRNVEYNNVIHNCFIRVPCCLAPPGNSGSPTRGLWNSADGTATRYFLGGPRFEIWWGKRFSLLRNCPDLPFSPRKRLYNWYQDTVPAVTWRGRGVDRSMLYRK